MRTRPVGSGRLTRRTSGCSRNRDSIGRQATHACKRRERRLTLSPDSWRSTPKTFETTDAAVKTSAPTSWVTGAEPGDDTGGMDRRPRARFPSP
jgi:hypothetical protein